MEGSKGGGGGYHWNGDDAGIRDGNWSIHVCAVFGGAEWDHNVLQFEAFEAVQSCQTSASYFSEEEEVEEGYRSKQQSYWT